MKTLLVLIATLSLSTSYAANRPSLREELADFIVKNKEKVLEIAKSEYEYTYYSFPIEANKCVAKKSPIGPVGMCLVTALANEENAIAYFSVNVTSDYSGTGETKRKLSITLIDYEI